MQEKPTTTLFMLMSLDGKISTGALDERDVDIDFPLIPGVAEGLYQYYDIEQTTDLWSLNSGRVLKKIGVNEDPFPKKTKVSFVVIDNHNLTSQGVDYLCHFAKQLVIVSTNSEHPGFQSAHANLKMLFQKELNLQRMLEILYQDFQCQKLTIQTGGTLNSMFLRDRLIDYVDVVVAPVLIGGKDTATLIDGSSLESCTDLNKLGALVLKEVTTLEYSYLRLRYQMKV